MIDKMTVVFVKQTGHVFAAVTRTAEPTSDISAESLAHSGLLVRGLTAGVQFEVPEEELAVLTVDLEPVVLLRPREFFVDEAQQAVVELPAAPVPPGAALANPSVTPTQVTVTLGAATPTKVKSWVQIEGGNLMQPRIAAGEIAVNATSVLLPIETLDAGTYQVLTLATERPPNVTSVTIP
jgi:hypothetical protein